VPGIYSHFAVQEANANEFGPDVVADDLARTAEQEQEEEEEEEGDSGEDDE
jgi:hypothetical protein